MGWAGILCPGPQPDRLRARRGGAGRVSRQRGCLAQAARIGRLLRGRGRGDRLHHVVVVRVELAHLALHPFGQIPTYEEGDLALFETGSIVFHIAERHAGLLPDDANARARAITWMFAALNTVEPPILELANARLLEGDKPGARSACLWSRIASATG